MVEESLSVTILQLNDYDLQEFKQSKSAFKVFKLARIISGPCDGLSFCVAFAVFTQL